MSGAICGIHLQFITLAAGNKVVIFTIKLGAKREKVYTFLGVILKIGFGKKVGQNLVGEPRKGEGYGR